MLKVQDLEFSIEEKKILENISLQVDNNQFIGIIGANGCGKSTLLKNIYGYFSFQKGSVQIDETEINSYRPKDLAKKIAVLAQKQNVNFDFTVEEIVEMGRYAHENFSFIAKGKKEILEALDEVGMLEMKDKSFLATSGGEMQRVLIARALAQKSDILILDEPTNHLDIKYQIQIMDLIKKINKTTLAVIHDMNIASSYCDYIYAMKHGKIIVHGTPHEVFTKENIKEIFDINCEISEHPIRKNPLIIF